MTAQVYSAAAWVRARADRALSGKAPRLAVIRMLVIRQRPDGGWGVGLMERRYGVWKKPEWLCGATSYAAARAVAEKAWRKHRLPIAYVRPGERSMRPFHINRPEPIGGVA
ncbi:hypothetical protein [Sphingomonas faeni]|uniref:hypothetical protein n=1 Tax=Sphingomonas faeni TaxID=185950 RepID=UPI00278A22AD|nr:hypothetical protein [Sphingomonas faeni]MDQ0839411.1 hypothetical protein [Sphingomonas faeni]